MLPANVHVIVRDWLNANHVLFLHDAENVLVDAGHVTHADTTLRLVSGRLAGRPLHRLLNTHCHSDHMGGNAAVRRAFGCTVHVPVDEAPLVERWDDDALWLGFAGQQAERFAFDGVLRPGEVQRLGGRDWLTLAAPGHDMGALVFWNEADGVLISGDALWERSFGIVLPGPGWRDRLEAARATLHAIRALRPRVVIPGHGAPFTAVDAAVDACLGRIAFFEADEVRLARNVLKVMLVFSLMERGRLREADLGAFAESVPMYGQYDAEWFGQGAAPLARQLAEELLKAGALRRDDGWLLPA